MVKESYYGAFINPYTSQPFTDEEIRVIIDRVMRGAEKSQLPEYMTQLNSQASRVPKEIAASLAQLAFICVADFNEKTNYADSSTAYISFIRHLNSLSSETQNAVRRFVIIYKDTKSNPPIQKRWALGELLDGMGRGDVCNHQAAVYYFTAAKQIDPSVIDLLDEETRQRFAHENHYHHGLDFERVPLVPAWILKLLTERPKSK
jgi:hypothetical protein